MPTQLRVTTGKENQSSSSVDVFSFWCPRNPSDGKECALSESTKNPRSGIKRLGPESTMEATTTIRAGVDNGQWRISNYELPAGTITKIYISRRRSSRTGGTVNAVIYLKMRAEAPLHELRIPLLQHNNSTLTFATYVGRFDVLVRKEARELGCRILDHHYNFAAQANVARLEMELIELEPAIKEESVQIAAETVHEDGTKTVVKTAWRGRKTA